MTVSNYYHKVEIGGVDITTHLLRYSFTDSTDNVVDECSLTCSMDVKKSGALINPGSEITIRRGTSASDLIYLFRGYVVENNPRTTEVQIRAANKLWVLKQRQVTKSFDKNIDSENGKLSEIAKTLITTFGGLDADNNTVQDSGTTLTLNKYLCINDEVFERVMKLVDALGWQMYYNPIDDKVYIEEYGRQSYFTSINFNLSTTNILRDLPTYKENFDNLINKITINGAKQLDTKTETFSGDGVTTEFTLLLTPQTTKIDISSTLQVRGVRSGDTSTFDYYIEEDTKKVVFVTAPASGTDNITVEYSTMVPVPVVLTNDESIESYSPTNPTTGEKTPFHKTITFTDIIDVDDAINRGRKYLDAYSTPFVSYYFEIYADQRVFFPGHRVEVNDIFNEFNGELVVKEVLRTYPVPFDTIQLSDNRLYAQTLESVEERVAKLEKEALRNIGTLFSVFDQGKRDIDIQNRYCKRQTRTFNGDGFVVGKHSIVGNNSVGADSSIHITKNIIPGNFSFDEYFYDTEFVDTTNSTATVDTTNWRVADTAGGGGFLLPTILQSEAVYGNQLTINSFAVTIRWTGGGLQFYYGVSSTAETSPSSWTEVTGLSSGVAKGVTVSSGDKFLYYRIVKDFNTVIQGTQNSFGRFTAPALRINNVLEA